jgi:hypothetical protein
MATNDTCVSIDPFFTIKDGSIDKVREYLPKFVAMTQREPACLYYGFTLHGSTLHCREGYKNAEGVLAHLDNVGGLLGEFMGAGIVELTELQLHGPEQELAKLRGPLADMNPQYWVLEYGFRS